MTRSIYILAVLPLAGLLAQRTLAGDVKTGDTDQDFVIKAIAAQVGEMKLAETALKNASSKDVRGFAQHVIDDHTKIRDDLMEWAKSAKLAVVQGLEKEFKEKVERLSKVEGADFDREFMKIMVADHERSLKTMQAHAKATSDAALRKLLEKTTPTVQDHLKKARQIAESLK